MQEGCLFKDNAMCIPKTSLGEALIKEHHARGLVGHAGRDKTISTLKERYFWPKLKKDVARFIQHSAICQTAKGTDHNIGFYTSLSIPTII